MKFYILKNQNGEYFYNQKNFLDSPEFGAFNLSSMTLFEKESYAATCKTNIENITDMDLSIEELSVSITEVHNS